MCRIPKQRNGLLEYKAPQDRPIQSCDNACHRNGGDEGPDGTATIFDVGIRYFMQCHKDRGKDGIHGHGYGERHKEFRETKFTVHKAGTQRYENRG